MSDDQQGALVPVAPEGAVPARRPPPAPAPAEPPASARDTLRDRLTRRRERMSTSRAALLSMTSQEAPLSQKEEEGDLLWFVMATAMRLVGLVWFAASVVVWGRLVGALGGGVSGDWHDPTGPWLGTMVAAVVVPVVSVGLWLASSWGAVVWSAAVLAGCVATLSAPGGLPLGASWLVPNLVAVLVVGALAGFRAWRDRDLDE